MTQIQEELQVSPEMMDRIVAELLNQRANYSGTDSEYATIFGINKSVFSSLKNNKREGLLSAAKWLNIAQMLNVSLSGRTWKFVMTEVVNQIYEEVVFCQTYSTSMMYVDEYEIGKTTAARYCQRMLKNCFVVDVSQCKNARLFTRALARAIGLKGEGKLDKVKMEIKLRLRSLYKPVIILDEAGDAKPELVLEWKEYWNATERACAWYLLGAEGLRYLLDKGREAGKPAFGEMFSRGKSNYSHSVPLDADKRTAFYQRLITTVVEANAYEGQDVKQIVNRCIITDKETGRIAGLRRAEDLINLNAN